MLTRLPDLVLAVAEAEYVAVGVVAAFENVVAGAAVEHVGAEGADQMVVAGGAAEQAGGDLDVGEAGAVRRNRNARHRSRRYQLE